MIMPLGTYITPKRLIGLAADVCSADSAGIMLSRSGSASIEPIPRSTVRRGMAIFEMIIAGPFLQEARRSGGLLAPSVSVARSCRRLVSLFPCHRHAERRAPDDASDDGGPGVICGRRAAGDAADRRQVVMVEAAADRVGEKLPAQRADEVLPVRDHQRAQTGDAFEPRAVREHRRR